MTARSALKKRSDGIAAVIESLVAAFLAAAAAQGGLEGADVRALHAILSFHLNWIPVLLQRQFDFAERLRFGADGGDPSIDAEVAAFGFVLFRHGWPQCVSLFSLS